MPIFVCQGLRCLQSRPLSARQDTFSPSLKRLRGLRYTIKAVRRFSTHAAEQAPLEVEVLPGPTPGTYKFRRKMSQQRHVRETLPFIIGVAGGTASGKTSVCESFPVLTKGWP